MADTMQFDLVSPERRLVSGAAKSVLIPGADGDMVAMPAHAPVITTLRPGVLSVELEGGAQEFVVTGGFAEVSGDSASILAEEALPTADVTAEFVSERVETARTAAAEAGAETIDAANKRLADLEALAELIG